jgi:hypothetical protein
MGRCVPGSAPYDIGSQMHFLAAFTLRPELFSQLKTRQVADEDVEVVLNRQSVLPSLLILFI